MDSLGEDCHIDQGELASCSSHRSSQNSSEFSASDVGISSVDIENCLRSNGFSYYLEDQSINSDASNGIQGSWQQIFKHHQYIKMLLVRIISPW